MNHVVLHYPFGAGGNFVKNCINLDPKYDSFWAQDRDTELIEYYKDRSRKWLEREWDVRQHLLPYYNVPVIKHMPDDKNIVFDCHGDQLELEYWLENRNMDIKHIFILPDDIEWCAKMYRVKAGEDETDSIINHMERLPKIKQCLKIDNHYVAEELFESSKIIFSILDEVGCQYANETVELCWSLWSEHSKELFKVNS